MPDDIGGEIVVEDAALAGGFVQVPAAVFFDADLTSGAVRVYGALLWYAWKGRRFPGQRVMGEELGGGERTIRRHLADLEGAGYIAFERVGLGKPNRCIIRSLQNRPSPDRPILAGQTGHKRPVNAASSGRSQERQDSKAHTSQQQGRRAKPEDPHDQGLPAARRTAVVVASSADDQANGEPLALADRLAALGVARSTAGKLLREHGPELVGRWIAYAEHKLAQGWLPQETPAAWLVAAVRAGDWIIPDWFKTPQERAEAAAADRQAEQELARRREEAATREREEAAAQRLAFENSIGVDDEARRLWQQTRDLLDVRGEGSIALAAAYLLPVTSDVATLATPVAFFRDRLADRAETIRAALEEASGRPVREVKIELVKPEVTA